MYPRSTAGCVGVVPRVLKGCCGVGKLRTKIPRRSLLREVSHDVEVDVLGKDRRSLKLDHGNFTDGVRIPSSCYKYEPLGAF